MTNSEVSSNKPAALSNRLPPPASQARALRAGLAFLIVSAFGFADATYLTTKHFLGTPVACSILKGCEQVTTSSYSLIFGIPVALLGSIYYLTILILSIIYLDSRKINPDFASRKIEDPRFRSRRNRDILIIIAKITPLGFLASLYFVYLQIFIIKAICLYCMASAATSTILFILGMFYLKKNKTKSEII